MMRKLKTEGDAKYDPLRLILDRAISETLQQQVTEGTGFRYTYTALWQRTQLEKLLERIGPLVSKQL